VPWQFVAGGLSASANSLVGSAGILKKIYFPRLIIPIANVVGGLVDFALAFGVLLLLILLSGRLPTLNVIFLPFFVLLALVTALGVGLWLSALNVQFRDVRYVIPFLTQFWLFITPIAYPASLIQDDLLRTLYGLNPMVGVVEGFRWALLGVATPPGAPLLASASAALLLLITGGLYFRRLEKTFADVV
jgi:lipopolysaccharide transport system permease protein